MEKRGQLTIFIVIGLVIVIILGLALFLLKSNTTKTDMTYDKKGIMLKSYVEDCLKAIGIRALYLQGLQGGYVYPIEDSFLMEEYSYVISYLYTESENNVPSREQMENEINMYIHTNLNSCLDDFIFFRNQGYEIEKGELVPNSTVAIDDVSIKINYPISLKQEDKIETIEEFSVLIPIRLGHLNDLSRGFIGAVVQDPSKIDMTMLAEFDVDVVIIPYDERTIIYSFYDEKSNVNDKVYIFLFATKI